MEDSYSLQTEMLVCTAQIVGIRILLFSNKRMHARSFKQLSSMSLYEWKMKPFWYLNHVLQTYVYVMILDILCNYKQTY